MPKSVVGSSKGQSSDTFQPKIFPFKFEYFVHYIKSQKSVVGRTEGLCSDTFQPKIFRLKLEYFEYFVHSIKSQKSMVGKSKGPCSDTFQPKIFRLKTEKITPYIVTNYVYTSKLLTCEKRCVNTQQMATCPKMSFYAFCVELLKHDFFMICD